MGQAPHLTPSCTRVTNKAPILQLKLPQQTLRAPQGFPKRACCLLHHCSPAPGQQEPRSGSEPPPPRQPKPLSTRVINKAPILLFRAPP